MAIPSKSSQLMLSVLALSLLAVPSWCQTTETDFQDEQIMLSCLVYEKLNYFDFRKLHSEEVDYSFTNQDTMQTYTFNLCSYTNMPTCSGLGHDVFAFKTDQSGECVELTDNSLTNVVSTVIQNDDGSSKVEITYGGGEHCPFSTTLERYSFTVELLCDSAGDKDADPVIVDIDARNPCNSVITLKHKEACPVFSASSWVSIFLDQPYILSPILIVFGFLVAYNGRKFFSYTVGFLGALWGFLVCFSLFTVFQMLDTQGQSDSALFVVAEVSISILTGLLVGFILTQMLHIGAAILGAICGSFIALALYNLLFAEHDMKVVLWVMTAIFCLIMAFLSHRFYDHIVIFCMAFTGAYMIIRGLSFILGYYPSEAYLVEQIDSKEPLELPWQFYLYLGGFVVIFTASMVLQFKQKHKEEESNFIKVDDTA